MWVLRKVPLLGIVALRKESVDRNIPSHWMISRTGGVALRKESVDRNVFLTLTVRNVPMSLSARRAWIEMDWASVITAMTSSLSARRAWIEIIASNQNRLTRLCRSPQGERG